MIERNELQARLERLIAEVRELVDAAAEYGRAEGFCRGHAEARLKILAVLQPSEAVDSDSAADEDAEDIRALAELRLREAAATAPTTQTQAILELIMRRAAEGQGTVWSDIKAAKVGNPNLLYRLRKREEIERDESGAYYPAGYLDASRRPAELQGG